MIRIMKYGETPVSEIFSRFEPAVSVSDAVAGIIRDVRERGDEAVLEYTQRFDKVKLSALEVSRDEIDSALESVDPGLLDALKAAAENIKAFHSCQLQRGFRLEREDGVVLGQKITPLEKAGVYVPGGTAAYPSTVLMDIIPAKLAGVGEIIMVTPPGKDGTVSQPILAAANIAGADRIFKVGGAQAVAALAFGTKTIPGVDKIVGPGNAYVAEAKRQVFGKVSIDMVAGPSEILIVSDGKTDPAYAAADLLSQAEHDRMASAVLVTDSMELAGAVQGEIEAQLAGLEREEIARASIESNGKIIVAPDLETAVDIANEIAPEHLELCVDDPFSYLDRIRCAGSVFLGRSCPEAVGDYYAGTNHTLPTGGTARFSSPLSVDDFIKKSQYIYYTDEALRKAEPAISILAEREGLAGHARSVTIRTED